MIRTHPFVLNIFVNFLYALRYIPLPLDTKHKRWVMGDASFAPTGEKSQQGLIVNHGITSAQRTGENLVQWRSSRQDLIAKSTCEAELIASSKALQEGENIGIVAAEMTNQSCETHDINWNFALHEQTAPRMEAQPFAHLSTLDFRARRKDPVVYTEEQWNMMFPKAMSVVDDTKNSKQCIDLCTVFQYLFKIDGV